MSWAELGLAVLAFSGLASCAPALDWREFSPEGSRLTAVFPCRPDRHSRQVALPGATAPMQMVVCAAGGATYAITFVDVDAPARVGPTLAELRTLAARNIEGSPSDTPAFQVPGMTPNPQAGRLTIAGRLPDGAPVQAQAVFFSKGLRVYQASVIGAVLPEAATQPFFSGLKLPA